MYVGKEGLDNSAGEWYFAIFINSYSPTFFQYLRSTVAYKTRDNAADIIDAFFQSKERIGVGDQFLDDWRFLYISSKATTGGVTTSLNDWGTGQTGDREGYIYSIDLYIYYHTNSTAIPDNSTQETAYVAKRNRVEPVKAYRQIGLAATKARQGTFATPRINNALTIFTPSSGSNGAYAPDNPGDNALLGAGNRGTGGNPGTNGARILTTPSNIFNNLISI